MNTTTRTFIVLTLSIIVGGLLNQHAEGKQVKVSDAKKAFIGDWCNTDFSTRGITRVSIKKSGGEFIVHMWGRCHPKECDWGDATATLDEEKMLLKVEWDQKFCLHKQELVILHDGTLQVTCSTHYVDNSKRQDRTATYQFKKGLKHDWSDAAQK